MKSLRFSLSRSLDAFLSGMGSVLALDTGAEYIRPEGGFARDAAALRGDARRVGSDLRRTALQAEFRHGKQVHHRKG